MPKKPVTSVGGRIAAVSTDNVNRRRLVIAAIFAINEFLFTLLIASTSKAYTMSVALANFTGGSDGVIYNAIALVSFLAFAPILILVILIQKHLSRGLTMGAVKG